MNYDSLKYNIVHCNHLRSVVAACDHNNVVWMWANSDKSTQETEMYGVQTILEKVVCLLFFSHQMLPNKRPFKITVTLRYWEQESTAHCLCSRNSRWQFCTPTLVPASVEVNWCGWMGLKESKRREENNRRDSVTFIRSATVQRTLVCTK